MRDNKKLSKSFIAAIIFLLAVFLTAISLTSFLFFQKKSEAHAVTLAPYVMLAHQIQDDKYWTGCGTNWSNGMDYIEGSEIRIFLSEIVDQMKFNDQTIYSETWSGTRFNVDFTSRVDNIHKTIEATIEDVDTYTYAKPTDDRYKYYIRIPANDGAGTYKAQLKYSNDMPYSTYDTITIKPLELIINGLKVKDKIYDGTTTGEVDSSDYRVVTYMGYDDPKEKYNISLNSKGIPSGLTISNFKATFNDKNVGLQQADISYNTQFTTSAENNFILKPLAGSFQATISQKDLTISDGDITASKSKVYDGNTDFTGKGDLKITVEDQFLNKLASVDKGNINLSYTAAFENATVGQNKTVKLTGISLTGSSSVTKNYNLKTTAFDITGSNTTASITQFEVTKPTIEAGYNNVTTYTGKSQSIKLKDFNTQYMEVDGKPTDGSQFNPSDSTFSATNAKEYTLPIKLKDKTNYKWKGTDSSDSITLTFTINAAKITADDDKMNKLGEDVVYRTSMSAIELKLPASSDTAKFPFSLLDGDDWGSAKFEYYIATHKPGEHKDWEENKVTYFNNVKEGKTYDGKDTFTWQEYNAETMSVTTPNGYCVFYKISRENYEPYYGYFSVHIYHELLYIRFINQADVSEEIAYGSVSHSQEALREKFLKDDIVEIWAASEEKEGLKTELEENVTTEFLGQLQNFNFYFIKDGDDDETHIEPTEDKYIGVGTYELYVEYVGAVQDEDKHISFKWLNSGDTEQRPTFTVKPKEITLQVKSGEHVYGETPETPGIEEPAQGTFVGKENIQTLKTIKYTYTKGGTGVNSLTAKSDAGEYVISAELEKEENYKVTFKSGKYTIKKADIEEAFDGGKFAKEHEYIYSTEFTSHPIALKLPESTDPNFPFALLEGDRFGTVDIRYIIATHTAGEHDTWIKDDHITKLLDENKAKDISYWKVYTSDKSSDDYAYFNRTEPLGYCVFYRLELKSGAGLNYNVLYGYFSVHIYNEELDITLKSATGIFDAKEYGEVAHSQDVLRERIFAQIDTIKSKPTQTDDGSQVEGEDRTDYFKNVDNRKYFTFYFRPQGSSDKIYPSADTRLDAGTYDIYVEYVNNVNNQHIIFKWYTSDQKEQRPTFTVEPRKVSVELTINSAGHVYGQTPVTNWITAGTPTRASGNWFGKDGDDLKISYTFTSGTSTAALNAQMPAGKYIVAAVCGNKNYSVTFTFKDGANTYTVEKATPAVKAAFTMPQHIYTSGSLPQITAEAVSGTLPAGTIAWEEYTLEAGVHKYRWTFTPTDAANYNAVSDEVEFTIEAVQLASITATFNQGDATIYDDATLDDLKQYLTVTGTNNDGTSAGEITDYTLSGTLSVGTATITVSYNSLTTSFAVKVTAHNPSTGDSGNSGTSGDSGLENGDIGALIVISAVEAAMLIVLIAAVIAVRKR